MELSLCHATIPRATYPPTRLHPLFTLLLAAYFGLTPNGRDTASAACAVIVSYLIIALFACHAMTEQDEETEDKKQK